MKMNKIGRICLAAAALMLVLFTAMPVSKVGESRVCADHCADRTSVRTE